MSTVFAHARQKWRKQVHKYWQRSLPFRLHTLDIRFLRFVIDYLSFARRSRGMDDRFHLGWTDRLACLQDRTKSSEFDAPRVYGLAWAARVLALVRPSEHVDVGSDLALSTLVSAFVPVRRLDAVPVRISLPGLKCGVAKPRRLPVASGSLKSVSCMGPIEHAGLGRFGDVLDPQADLQIIDELLRVLQPGGALLFSAPVGLPRIRFNAYRIYSYQQISEYFAGLRIKEFALIDDGGCFWPQTDAVRADAQRDARGCWWFIR